MLLKQLFPYGNFNPAAQHEQIAAVELSLSVQLPEQLRALYLECDGFREDIGNATYLLSLAELRAMTEFCRIEFKETWPTLDLTPFIFFGSSCSDQMWGIRWESGNEIIAFHHNMEGVYETVGLDILSVYQADYSRYPSEA